MSLLHKAVPPGAIVGRGPSEQKLRAGRRLRRRARWGNVRLLAAPVGQASIDVSADAALFCAVHDVL